MEAIKLLLTTESGESEWLLLTRYNIKLSVADRTIIEGGQRLNDMLITFCPRLAEDSV